MRKIETQINAARIAKINHSVTLNSTLSPYMLFPVRLETHFREKGVSTRPVYKQEIETVLRNYLHIIGRLYEEFFLQNIRPGEFKQTLPEVLYDLRAGIEELDLLSPEEKGVIEAIAAMLEKKMHQVTYIRGNEQLRKYFREIVDASKNIQTSTSIKENPATSFFRELRANYKALKTLAEYTHTPYRSKRYYKQPGKQREENERLYRYVTGRIMRIAHFFNKAKNRLADIPSLDNRQRLVATRDLFANDFSVWLDLFSSVERNMQRIYNGLPFQSRRLMEKYNSDWKKMLAESEAECRRFTAAFKESISCKPRTAFHFTRLLQSVFQLDIELLNASVCPRNIAMNELSLRISKINRLADGVFLDYVSEKELLLESLRHLRSSVARYISLMKNENFVDYQEDRRNTLLLEKITTDKIEGITAASETFVNQKQLCVRIFPDDIFVHQHEKLLTQEEVLEGKRFWIKWFIASGNKIYEKEAWNIFCQKYDVMRASWIARMLYPLNLSSFLERRPYKNSEELQRILSELIEIVSECRLSESYSQTVNENNVKQCIGKMIPKFYKVREIVMQYDKIVDYLYRKINNDLGYVKRHLEIFLAFYDKNPRYRDRADMAYRDADHQLLSSFYAEWADLIMHMKQREVSLEEMVKEYLDRLDKKNVFFPALNHFRDPDVFAPPVSTILPDRFLFFGDTKLNVNGKLCKKRIVFAGRKVKKDLKLSIDLGEDANVNPYNLDLETGEIDIRGGIRWMTDYETAVRSGMAITVPLPHDDREFRKAKFSVIYVLGVKDNVNPKALEDFFNGHIYGASGMDFLKIGTPTNSFDGIVSGYNSDESKIRERRFEIEVEQKFKGDNNALFNSIHNVLGLSKTAFNNSVGRVNSYDNTEILKATATNRIMCDVFKNYFSMSRDGSVLHCRTRLFLNKIPDFVSSYCLARGVIPPVRIGNQPYGILPTTAFSRFEFESPSDTLINNNSEFLQFARQLHQLLKRITDVWNVIRKKYVICSENLGTAGAQERYIEMMNLTPTSVSFFERTLIEAAPLLDPLINVIPLENPKYFKELGSSQGIHIRISKILKDIFDIQMPDKEQNVSILKELPLFRAHPVADMVEELKDEAGKEPDLKPFIDKILSRENKEVLLKLVPEDEIPLLIIEFMDLFSYRLDAWWLGLVNYQLQRIRRGTFGSSNSSTAIGAFGWLFDLEKRENKSKRRLSSEQSRDVSEKMNLRDKESPVYQDEQHNEFLLAPSINHAITGAILRSSYKKSMKQDGDNRLCINLSSLRVRQALRIIDGIRNGLSIGAVLGADLERALHEAYKKSGQELNRYVYPLRQLFPLKIDIKSEQKDNPDNTYVMSVINGELLLNRTLKDYNSRTIPLAEYLLIEKNESTDWFHLLLEGRPAEHKKQLALLIEQMADTFDALSDLVLSEGVYQLVQGNRVAFAALMQNMQDGRFSTQPQITEIPMQSAVIRHKAGISFRTVSDIELAGWNRSFTSENKRSETVIDSAEWMMSKIEPSLNHWIGTILGSSSDICFVVTSIDAIDGNESETDVVCSLSELGIAPLEYLYLSSDMHLFVRFLELKFRKKYNLFDQKLSIDYMKKKNTWEKGKRTLYENEWVMNNLRSLLSNSKALTAEDFSSVIGQTDENNLKGLDIADLENRYETLLLHCEKLNSMFLKILRKYIPSEKSKRNGSFISKEDYSQIIDLLILCAEIGITGAITSLPAELFDPKKSEEDIFKAQSCIINTLRTVADTLSDNIQNAKEYLKELVSDDEESAETTYTKVIQSLLSSNFKVIPRFTLKPLSEKDFNNQSIQSENDFSYSNAAPLDMEIWTAEVSKVRESMGCLQQIRMFSDFSGISLGEASVFQIPFDLERDKEWVGREVSSEEAVRDKDSLVLFDKENFSSRKDVPNTGIIFDQWMELIPYEHQRGGVVFNFDQPNAEAPQVILLAVPAKITMRRKNSNSYEAKNWTLNDLITTLNDTRIMAQNRAVEPDHLYAETNLAKIIPMFKYDTVEFKD